MSDGCINYPVATDEQVTSQHFSGRVEYVKDAYIGVFPAMEQIGGLCAFKIEYGFAVQEGRPSRFFGEALIDFSFDQPISLRKVRDAVRTIDTTEHGIEWGIEPHVFLQTLRPVPLAENCCERDYNL